MLTANNKNNLLEDVYGLSLLTWVLLIYNDDLNKHVIKYGSFKFDTLAVILHDLFSTGIGFTNDLIAITDVIHISHTKNYLFWKKNRPWEYTNSIYSNPFKERGDKYEKYQYYQNSIDLPYKRRSKLAMLARRIMHQVVHQSHTQSILLKRNDEGAFVSTPIDNIVQSDVSLET
jgi:hypothetical protein